MGRQQQKMKRMIRMSTCRRPGRAFTKPNLVWNHGGRKAYKTIHTKKA